MRHDLFLTSRGLEAVAECACRGWRLAGPPDAVAAAHRAHQDLMTRPEIIPRGLSTARSRRR
jgi:hypothetical protein